MSGPGSDLSAILFALAKKENQQLVVQDQLNQLKAKFKEDILFWNLFRSNSIEEEHLKKLGCTESLFHTLIIAKKKGQLQNLAQVIRYFNEMLQAEIKELDAVVTVASPMGKAEQDKMVKSLKAEYPHIFGNCSLNIVQKTDFSLLEGYTVEVGDFFVDRSARIRLANFENFVMDKIDSHFGPQIAEVQRKKGWH